MPFPIQLARYAQGLRRLFGIQGHVGLQLIDDVFPTVDLHSPAPEDFYLRGEERYAQGITAAAVVGQFSFAAFGIDGATLGLAVLERLVVRNVSAGSLAFTLCLEPADVGVVPNGVPVDSRLGLVRTGTKVYITQAAAAAFPSVVQRLWSIDVPAGASADLLGNGSPLPVIAPGARYSVYCGTVNTTFFLSGGWREWVPGPQELRGG